MADFAGFFFIAGPVGGRIRNGRMEEVLARRGEFPVGQQKFGAVEFRDELIVYTGLYGGLLPLGHRDAGNGQHDEGTRNDDYRYAARRKNTDAQRLFLFLRPSRENKYIA